MTFRAAFEHRDELLRAAIDEFCARGYDAASINRILTASQMSKGQLYHHFDGKAGLYLALVEWMIDERGRWFERHPVGSGDGFFDTLRARMAASAAFASENREVQRFSRALLAERGRPIFQRATERFGFTGDTELGDLVTRHHARGDFRSDLSVAFVQRVVLLIVNHAPDLLALDDPGDLAPQVDDLLMFLEHGLGRAGGGYGQVRQRPFEEP